MAGSITDIVSAVQNSVVAMNSFAKQLTGSFNNIAGKITSINGLYGPFTLNATTGITNSSLAIQLEQASSAQFGAVKVDGTSILAAAGVISTNPAQLTNSLSSDHLLSNTANYFDGPTVANSTTGTWYASGTVTLVVSSAATRFNLKLWDGTTVIDSAQTTNPAAALQTTVALSGYITNPSSSIRISVRDTLTVAGLMLFNASGNSKDCTLSAFRIA